MQSRYVWSGRGGKGRGVAKGEHLGNVVTLDTSQVYSGFWQPLDTLGIKSSQHAGIPLYPSHSHSLSLSLSLCLSPIFLTPTWWTLFAFGVAYSTDLVTVCSSPKRPLSAVLGTFFYISQYCHASHPPPSLVARQLSHRAFLYKNFCSFRKQLSHSFRSDSRQTLLHLPGTFLPSLPYPSWPSDNCFWPFCADDDFVVSSVNPRRRVSNMNFVRSAYK